VNALATENAGAYLPDPIQIVRRELEPEPRVWWGGHVAWGVSWNLLYQHARNQRAEAWASGKLDDVLDALESPATGPPAPAYYSSSEPRDLYALYLVHGQKERAKKFRALCKKGVPYDMEMFFDQADKSPAQYQRGPRDGY
jgi:hypothetical protein